MRKRNFLLTIVLVGLLISGCIRKDILSETKPPSDEGILSTETLAIEPLSTANNTLEITPSLDQPSEVSFDNALCEGDLEEKYEWNQKAHQLNEDCRFPCVANHLLIMGETEVDELKQNLDCVYNSYSDYSIINRNLAYYYQLEGNEFEKSAGISFVEKDNEILFVVIPMFGSIHELLELYGAPDEIWAWGEGEEIFKPFGEFIFSLYYEEIGLIVSFMGDANTGEYLEICPSEFDTGMLSVLLFGQSFSSENDFLTIYDSAVDYSFVFNIELYPLEELSNIDTEWFYHTYLEENSKQCFSILSAFCYEEKERCSFDSVPTPID